MSFVKVTPDQLRQIVISGPFGSVMGKDVGIEYDVEMLEAVMLGRMFWFGDVTYEFETLKKYFIRYLALLKAHHIDHPYEDTYAIAYNHGNATHLIGVTPDEEGSFILTVGVVVYDAVANENIIAMLGCWGVDEEDMRFDEQISVASTTIWDEGAKIIYDDSISDTIVIIFAFIVLLAVGVLATNGVDVETDAPPVKVNKRRVANGKPEIPPMHRVNLAEYITALNNTEHRVTTGGKGGTHASPIPHLRRGHIRRLAGRDTWVRDCLVNVRKEGIQPTFRQHYSVGKGVMPHSSTRRPRS